MQRPFALTIATTLALAGCPARQPPATLPVHGSTAALQGERATTGSLQSRLAVDDARLALFYTGELQGSLEPCGCPKEPRGGLPRLATYVAASSEANPGTPSLLLNGGYWLEDAIGLGGGLRGDVPLMNGWMVRGLQQLPWDALNLGYTDLPGLVELGGELAELPLVSANIQAREGHDVPQPERWRLVQAGDLRVGITGLSTPGVSFVPTPEYIVEPPLPAAERVLAEMEGQVDMVVLLAFQAIPEARALAQDHPEITVVIDTHHHSESVPPFHVGEATWVKSTHQGRNLGELRLWIEDGGITRALDRKVELDPDIRGTPALDDTMVRAHQEIERKAREIWGE